MVFTDAKPWSTLATSDRGVDPSNDPVIGALSVRYEPAEDEEEDDGEDLCAKCSIPRDAGLKIRTNPCR